MNRIKNKGHRPLPGRGAMNDLAASKRTLTDYSKASPMGSPVEEPTSLLTQFVKSRRR